MTKEVPLKTVGILLAAVALLAIMGTFLIVSGPRVTGFVWFNATGTAQATVPEDVTISLPTNTVNFATTQLEASNDTTDEKPPPFVIRNDGSTDVNVTINASALWAGSAVNTDYRYKCGDGEISCPANSTTTWANMPGRNSIGPAVARVIGHLPFNDSGDSVQIEIEITVPADEPQASPSSTVTFSACAD